MRDLKNFRDVGAHFYPVLMPFSCFNYKRACIGDFSFDSHSGNDE
jgi:hypothetical protein